MRLFKKILLFLFVMALLTVGGILYLNKVFFPLQVKNLVIQKAKILLKRDVSIEKLFFHPGKGILLENIRIDQNNGDPVPFLTIQEATISVPIPDIFSLWAKRLFISSITIKNPVLDLKYNSQGQWNFADLLALRQNQPKPATPAKAEKNPRFVVGSITINNGQATITDPTIFETINSINVNLHIDLLRNINFDLSFLLPSHSSVVNASGTFVVGSKELNADIKAKNADIPPLLKLSKIPLWVDFRECFLKKTDLSLKFKDGEITLDGSVSGNIDVSTTETATRVDVKTELTSDRFFFKRKGPHFLLKGDFIGANTILTVDKNKVFAGQYKGTSIVIDRTGSQVDLKGNIYGENAKMVFAGQDLTGNPQIENIIFQRRGTNVAMTGQAKITNATIKNASLDLDANTATADFDLKREISDLKLSLFNLSLVGTHSMYANKAISGDVKGENVIVSLTNQIFQTDGKFKTENLRLVIARSITLLGNPNVELTITKDRTLTPDEGMLSYSGTMTLNKDSLQGVPKFGDLTDLKGKISFNNDLAETAGLNAVIKGSPWQLFGKVNNFKEPTVSITARSQKMNLDLMKDLFAKKLQAANADISGNAENVVVKYEGQLFSKESTEITVAADLNSAEITTDKLPQKVTNMSGHVKYSADALDWKDLNFSYAGKKYLSNGSLRDFSTPDFKSTLAGDNFFFIIDGKTSDRVLSLGSFKGEFHRCPFDLKGTISFRKDIPKIALGGTLVDGKFSLEANIPLDNSQTSEVSLEVVDLNLEKLKNTIPILENKNIAGNLSLNTKLSGPLLDPDHWDGFGTMNIQDGKLLEIDVLKGIWKTLFSSLVVDDYKHIAFNQAKGSFKIAAGRIATKDLLLKSNAVDLSISGWAGVDGKINFDAVADVRQAPLVTSEAVKTVPSTIISQFAKNAVGFKLTGSLSQPQIKYKILPLKVLKKTGDSVFLGIQGMMEDLLQ